VIDVGFAAEGLFGGSTEYVARKTRDGWRFEPTGTVSVS